MTVVLYYAIIILAILVIVPLGVLLFKKNNNKFKVLLIVISSILALVFLCRYMLAPDAISNMILLESAPLDTKAQNFAALMLVWMTYSSVLLVILYGFFRLKLAENMIKFFVLPVSILNIIFLSLNFSAIIGLNAIKTVSARGILFALEIGITFAYALILLIAKTDWKNIFKKNTQKQKVKNQPQIILGESKKFLKVKTFFAKVFDIFKKYWTVVFCVLIIIFSTIPAYTMQGLFGFVNQIAIVKNFELPHRIVLYIVLILPFVIHFSLKHLPKNETKFYLLFICLGTLLSYSLNHKFASFLDPVLWPLHLCNTAMYIMPLVLIFNMKKFFYFTYFINVAGAFFAMFMPNYANISNLHSTQLVVFYINHYIAFFMPILFVSLNMFSKPKFKQFVYSMLAFLGYFVFVLFVNALFTGMHEVGLASGRTDFFFLNSDFIAEKLGLWAERLRDITAEFYIKNIKLVFYPLYQSLFFIAYVAIGLVTWFIYEQGFEIAASFADINTRKKQIKCDQLALLAKLNSRSVSEPMNEQNKDKLILKDFSKRYGNSREYAVKNANLEVNSGEIFGFLGPNGAGKSTIIKSIVGIQPITSGAIEVCGYDVDKQSVQAKRQIGFVPDNYALYEKLTGREYINYIADLYDVGLEERTKRIENHLKIFELEGAFDAQIKTYSHGMKQKVTIMSALVHNPKVWILDEPLTGLDPNSIFQVKECMKEHAKNGNIVFFSSHIIDVVERICDKIAIIKKGEILVCKSVKEIEKSGKTLEQYYMETIHSKGK